MLAFDASSIIHAWDQYPIALFPGVWEWFSEQMGQGAIVMSEVAMTEVGHKAPECFALLKRSGLRALPVTDSVLQEALRIKQLLGIEEECYGSGVDENDLIIIATANLEQLKLVTNESAQMTPSKLKRNWKIPVVCKLPTIDVPTLDVLSYLIGSGEKFG